MIKKILAIFLGIVIFGIGALAFIIYMPGKEKVDPLTYFSEFGEDQNNMVFEDQRVPFEQPVIEQNGITYVSSEVARAYLDKTIYYDNQEGIMTITTPQEVIRLYRNGTGMKVNGVMSNITDPIIEIGGIGYLPQQFLEERYDFKLEKGTDGRLYVASMTSVPKQIAKARGKKIELRTHPNRKALIVEQMAPKAEVTVYKVEDGYARVRSENGIIGFVPESDIKMFSETEVTNRYEKVELEPSSKLIEDKVKLVWDQMTVEIEGDWTSNKYQRLKDANVISPTWFEFADAEGNLTSRANKSYVQSAHNAGLQVWALISHNFKQPQFTREILTSTNKRQHVINQLLAAAEQYGFDGINIDIENVQEDFGDEWVQFMRELAPQMKQKGLTLSVDVYMPSAWSGHYQRAEIAEVVDYFIVMAYDQHWSGSDLAGPVAGLDWVEEGLQANLQEVPKEKLVLGVPFFTRVWEESTGEITSKAYGMDGAYRVVSQWGVPIQYDEQSGLNYAEATKGDKKYSVWLEDKMSIKKRMDLIKTYDLAGYAGWKLGLENNEAWDSLNLLD